MRKKLCVYKTCSSDSRYSAKDHMKGIFFITFPKPKTNRLKCESWLKWLGRTDYPISRVSGDTYLCSKHFVGGKGPTKEFPDPICSQTELVSILKAKTQKSFIGSVCESNQHELQHQSSTLCEQPPSTSSNLCEQRCSILTKRQPSSRHLSNSSIPITDTSLDATIRNIEIASNEMDSESSSTEQPANLTQHLPLNSCKQLPLTLSKEHMSNYSVSTTSLDATIRNIEMASDEMDSESSSPKPYSNPLSISSTSLTANSSKNFKMSFEISSTEREQNKPTKTETVAAELKAYVDECDKTFQDDIINETEESDDGKDEVTKDNSLNAKVGNNEFSKLRKFSTPMNWSLTLSKSSLRIRKFEEDSDKVLCSITIGNDLTTLYEALGNRIRSPNVLSNLPPIINTEILLQSAIHTLNSFKTCSGNSKKEYIEIFKQRKETLGFQNPFTGSLHSQACVLLVDGKKDRCFFCSRQRSLFRVALHRKKKEVDHQFKNLTKEELILKLRQAKSSEKKLKGKLKRSYAKMATQSTKNGECLDEDTHNFLKGVLERSLNESDTSNEGSLEFSKLFLRTQLKMLSEKHSNRRRWHPLIIKWCLYMYDKSPSLYKVLNESGVLQLPSRSTLRKKRGSCPYRPLQSGPP